MYVLAVVIPLKTVYVSRKRIPAYKNNNQSNKSSAIAFCWFVWEKGYSGDPVIKWINLKRRLSDMKVESEERKYEKWVKKGLEKAKDYAHKDRTEAGPITEFIRNIMEDAFYEGYMAAKEEKFHGKISII